jgi:probable HAF family extracellular repeat protein
LASNFTGPVSIRLGATSHSGTLTGITTLSALGGVAGFAALCIDQPANGYTLQATAAGFTPATSAPFDILALPPARQFRFNILSPFAISQVASFETPDCMVYPLQTHTFAIDSAGRAFGTSECDVHYSCAAVWGPDAKPESLWADGALLGAAWGVNAAGQVVGLNGCGGWGACLWEAGHLRALTSLGGRTFARSINNQGDAVGWSEVTPYGFEHAVLWRGDSVQDLGTLGGLQSEALAIDDSGRIVGWARPAGYLPPRHAFLWQNGTMTDLGTFGGTESVAEAINNSGQVVGWLGSIDGKHAFLWQNGRFSLLPGSEFSDAFGLNNRGDVVGTYLPSGSTFHAALWRRGVRYDLNDMVGDTPLVLFWAYAVNDAGVIVGVGARKRVYGEFGFRLTPTESQPTAPDSRLRAVP